MTTLKKSTIGRLKFYQAAFTAILAIAGSNVQADSPLVAGAGFAPAAISCLGCGPAPVQMAQLLPGGRNVGNVTGISRDFVPRGDPNIINMCCPPSFAAATSLGAFDRMATASGNGADPYGIRFTPAPGLDAAMLTFAPFAGQFTLPGHTANSIHLNAELKHFNPSTWTLINPPTMATFNSGTTLKSQSMRAWWTPVSGPSGVWNTPLYDASNLSNGWNVPSYQWERSFEVGAPGSMAPTHFQPNQWYIVKMSFKLAMKKNGDPNSWVVRDVDCNNMRAKYYRIRWDYNVTMKTTGGAPSVVVEELK